MDTSEQVQVSGKSPLRRLIPAFAFLVVALVAFFADRWYIRVYGRINFDSILYTLTADLAGTSSTLFLKYLLGGLLPAVVLAGVAIPLCCYLVRHGIVRFLRAIICIVSAGLIVFAAFDSQLVEYLYYTQLPSDLYEEEYADPSQVNVTFPEKKRNLIYIMLESYELSFTSAEQGGALDHDCMPELYALAQENLNFSQNESVGGFRPSTGATWTIGAMVSQTAGVPLAPVAGADAETGDEENEVDMDAQYSDRGDFLPGATTIQDVLHENGYYQALMVGSDADFANRRLYYSSHSVDKIYDLYTAAEDGIVEEGYHDGWWGMEDYHLFEYAKQELTKIAAQDQPFAFTMLTVDTHHVDGNWCDYCEEQFEEQYDNVFACSSRQVAAFVEWIQQQSFYENTTVIIVGDHCSMDAGYFRRNVDDDYIRRVYNCFINAAVDTEYAKNREFCTLDLFPTTLAAIGCTIEGDRLGLGTNLFSGEKTLMEQWGYDDLCDRLYGNRDYYEDNFTAS